MKLLYSLDQKPPPLKSILFGLQWAAIAVSSIIVFGKVIGSLHFNQTTGQVIYLQKMLFITAATTFSQLIWGHRLPLIAGPAAVLLIGVIASRGFEIDVIYTSIMIGGLLILVLALSGLFRHLRKLFTTRVVAVVLLLIALVLAPTIRNLMIGSKTGVAPIYNITFALSLTIAMFIFHRVLTGIWKSTLMIWSMLAGSLIYFLIFPASQGGDRYSDAVWAGGFFNNLTLHFSIEPGVLISFIFCFIALSINDLGSIQSLNELLSPANADRRITRGIIFTGLANIASGVFGIIGPVNYSLSPGVIASTGCASKITLIPAALIMALLSFFPAAIVFISSVPSVVISSLLLYIMTSQVAAGLIVAFRDADKVDFHFENGLIIGLPVILGTIIVILPSEVISSFPVVLRPILGNGFVAGIISAFIMEHLIFRE